MAVNLESGVIKILNAEGRVIGTGFVLTPALAVTCAHVIEAAGVQPGEKLAISFYGQAQKPDRSSETCQVSFAQGDVSFLRLERLPDRVRPVELGATAAGCEGQSFTTFGFASVADIPERHAQGSLGGIVQAPDGALLQ